MPYANKDEQKRAQREWYLKNKEKVSEKSRLRKKEIQKWYNEYKLTLKCSFCGYSGKDNPRTITFHHPDPEYKEEGISYMVRMGRCKKDIMNEMSKCVCICGNCHRRLHYDEYNYDEDKAYKKWYVDFKKSLSCEECGEGDYRCLEFHHIDDNKEDNISNLLDKHSINELIYELGKCKCLCVNCHKKHKSDLNP